MNAEVKSKWQIRLATLSIFLLGFLAGAFALNAYHLWFGASRSTSWQQRYETIFNQLNLTDSQKTDIQKVFSETREKTQKTRQEAEPRFQEIRTQSSEQLQKILTPEQWQKYQQEREKMRQDDKPDPPPRPLNLK